jgi:hypothetical protein
VSLPTHVAELDRATILFPPTVVHGLGKAGERQSHRFWPSQWAVGG